MMSLASIVLALALDKGLGEPSKWHPLVAFGAWANWLEQRLNRGQARTACGMFAVVLAVTPVVGCAMVIDQLSRGTGWLHLLVSGGVLYVAIGWQSLLSHAQRVAVPLAAQDSDAARAALAMIVSRDTAELTDRDIAKAATESVLENGADAIFSALFWFCLLGVPGVVCYRLSNTLDAMWGYKNERFLHFGWAAARLDDGLNFIPARLTALSYVVAGQHAVALRCWRQQAFTWKSPNAGPVMAAGAGALNVSLGGAAVYHGALQQRPVLGPEEVEGTVADAATIMRACTLVNRALLLWVVTIALIGWLC